MDGWIGQPRSAKNLTPSLPTQVTGEVVLVTMCSCLTLCCNSTLWESSQSGVLESDVEKNWMLFATVQDLLWKAAAESHLSSVQCMLIFQKVCGCLRIPLGQWCVYFIDAYCVFR